MLTQDYLNKITERTEEVTAQISTEISKQTSKHVQSFLSAVLLPIMSASQYNKLKMQKMSEVHTDATRIMYQKSGMITKESKKAFTDVTDKIKTEVGTATKEVAKIAKVELPENYADLTGKEKRMIDSAFGRTKKEIENITRTTASETQKEFINACDKAYYDAVSGGDIGKAITNAIADVAKQGVTTVTYTGKTDKIETAIARAVRTGLNQAHSDVVLTRCAEMGVGYVITSQHIGARVTPFNNFTNHSWWQGKVYSLDYTKNELGKYSETYAEQAETENSHSFFGKIKEAITGFINRKKYPDFIETCGYGQIQGICGINCRHSFSPFYPGISTNTYKTLDKAENKERYQLTQKQRQMEVAIRQTKREISCFSSVKESPEINLKKQELKLRLHKQVTEYNTFCTDNNLSTANWRLKIAVEN